MLGIVLLYVGAVLINNGIGRLYNIDEKSLSLMNLFAGSLAVIIDTVNAIKGDYYSVGTGLLFGFTYLFVGLNGIFNLDKRPYAWYSLFVAINTIPAAFIELDDWRMFAIWLLWGLLWLTAFIEIILKKNLGKFVPYLAIFEGVITAWIPGFLMLIGRW
ncbi:AmiS/UreI family transporter [uncultured Clostridium sp.]|uniref:AmiS/UreI family transporter n=1 Tax=uncultured Clostridium sp. TaxID=59620 RepID=UPI0025DEA8E8|nr:AmiS/UreI family transporter [uncultured Clostridium sp.]